MNYVALVVQDGMRYLSWSFGVHVLIRQVEELLQNLKREPRSRPSYLTRLQKKLLMNLLAASVQTLNRSGIVFVKEVADAYEIGSKQSDEAILTAK
jgi:hypothetical protein